MSQISLPDHADFAEKLWHWTFIGICALVFLFLIAPILVIIPLSFNAEPYFTFNAKMVALDPEAYSVRWYQDFWSKTIWRESIWNSLFIAVGATILATALGTLAALGLSRPEMPFKPLIMGLLISPMIVPLIITAAGIFFFYASINEYLQLTGSYLGVILAHTVLGTPFVVITVTATLSGFDHSLTRAGAMCGADPTTVFFKVIMPLILPGVISGALFAFVTSFDEVVVVLFVASVEQQTIPRQMWAGMRESISPTILAVATILICISILLLATVEILRRRSERLRGLSAG
jgi:putative spermidine/putrescine transport system permease protein